MAKKEEKSLIKSMEMTYFVVAMPDSFIQHVKTMVLPKIVWFFDK